MIRPITPADTPELVSLTDATGMFKAMEIQALQEVLDDFHATNHLENHQAVLLEQEGVPAGFAYYAPAAMTDRSWYLYWIAVRKEQQGKGLGRQLLHHVENDIRSIRAGRVLFIETGSLPLYEPTREFYRKNGFEQHALLRDFYADGDSMVVFCKRLVPPPI